MVQPSTSPWVGLPREGFTAAAAKRAEAIGNTKIGRTVPGRVNEP